jgi:hypothetical protein
MKRLEIKNDIASTFITWLDGDFTVMKRSSVPQSESDRALLYAERGTILIVKAP